MALWVAGSDSSDVPAALRPLLCIFLLCDLLCPRPGGIKRLCCLTSVWRLSLTSGRRAACVAGRLDSAYWLTGPARPAWLKADAARFRCRPGRGYIVAAARLQLVINNLSNQFIGIFHSELALKWQTFVRWEKCVFCKIYKNLSSWILLIQNICVVCLFFTMENKKLS